MRHLAALILIALVVLAPSCKFIKKMRLFGGKSDTLMVWQARQDSIRVADSIRSVQAALLASEQARLESERVAEEQAMLLRTKYNIIVGSFITPEYARALEADYRQHGYDARIIKAEGSSFEFVAAESHANLKTAIERLAMFQDTVVIDAWIFIRK
jgi:hypothetical protein